MTVYRATARQSRESINSQFKISTTSKVSIQRKIEISIYSKLLFRAVKLSKTKIYISKGGKQRIRDSGLEHLSDKEIEIGARNKSLPKSERERYKKEEKARKNRNKQKRR